MGKALLIFFLKQHLGGDEIAELKIWELEKPVRGSKHLFKYSLCYGRNGKRIVGYDNEPGKGDHRHYGEREEIYRFTTPEQLIDDFLADVNKIRRGEKPWH